MKVEKAILKCLDKILFEEGYSHLVLKKCYEDKWDFSQKKRIKWTVWEVMRKRDFLDSVILSFLSRKKLPGKNMINILRAAFLELIYSNRPDYSIVNNYVNSSKNNRSFLNGVLRNAARDRENIIEKRKILEEKAASGDLSSLVLLHSISKELLSILSKALSQEKLVKFIQDLDRERELSIRVNTLKISFSEFQDLLVEKGISCNILSKMPFGMKVKGSFENLPGYKEGWFTVQSPSSMEIGTLGCLKKANTLCDYCSFPGGKTGLIGELYPQLHLCAMNISEEKKQVTENEINRLQLKKVDFDLITEQWHQKNREKFDVVLVDAPCSGLGNLSKKPEIRFRITQREINDLSEVQLNILRDASSLVMENGYLIYSTCTITPEENDLVIEKFLQENKNFYLDDEDGVILRIPVDGDIDEGFFVGVLKRGMK